MTSFQALRLHDGKPEPARRIETLQPGDLSPGNVLIEVAYSSINHKDALAAHGRNGIIRQFPRIGGIDLTAASPLRMTRASRPATRSSCTALASA